jgi:hypothetical protein
MWDLETIKRMNAEPAVKAMRIFDLGGGKFALGNRGSKAAYVVRRVRNAVDRLGRGLPTYKGVQARRPRIPADAPIIRREDAGRLILRAFGLR